MSTTSPAPILRATDLVVGYGGPAVLEGVDLELVAGGAPVGVVGESGAGKSTLVQALGGQIRIREGHVTFEGRTVSRLSRRDKKRFRAAVRTVAQNGLDVDPRWTVERAVAEALKDARKAGRTSGQTVADLLDDVALPHGFAPRTVHTLSGGEKQRLALALALATRPEALLLDEPLTAVDPAMRGEVVRRLTEVADEIGTAVLLVSHDVELVDRLCPTVHVMAEGMFVASGALRDVFAEAAHPAVADLAENAPLAAQRFR
ncbi:ATP-binding cassette domain-containing protein [Isoptericola sp. NEAU-Y5]|uniref:ATP-binding cassette domain-containing protein n=1 Tax=Isoptericola luteus TaxID=2879484 RepID=A0ABS7ZJA4_9MICO|nr:ATP-binding cassette domain-containing protein [Isoptericola sp. NEAU-Y5]MCA5895106.1 ATP-binding cassette domain-containing protein [Isoptericola sp. NEAU-Y5]